MIWYLVPASIFSPSVPRFSTWHCLTNFLGTQKNFGQSYSWYFWPDVMWWSEPFAELHDSCFLWWVPRIMENWEDDFGCAWRRLEISLRHVPERSQTWKTWMRRSQSWGLCSRLCNALASESTSHCVFQICQEFERTANAWSLRFNAGRFATM